MGELHDDKVPGTDEKPGNLQQYLKLKLELAATIRSAMQLFQEAKDNRRESHARQLLSHLAEDRFNLVVVGQFMRGKTSLINAIIGMDRLPTGILPLTSVVTTVRYGDRECVLIRCRGSSLAEKIPLSRLEEYVTERGNPGNYRRVQLAEVLLPSKVLRLGFQFIETPGVGSSIIANTETTLGFLSEADAVIFVTSFEAAMNEGELTFLRTVARHMHKIFFVVNKVDLVPSEESETVTDLVRQIISTELGDTDPQVFAVSAHQGLEAKLAGNEEALLRSGLLEIESALTNFLISESVPVVVLRCIKRTMALLTPELIKSRASHICEGLHGDALQSIKHKWRDRMEQIETACLHLVEGLQGCVRSELPLYFERAITEHCTEIHDSLVAQVDLFLTRRKKFFAEQDMPEFADLAQNIANEHRQRWLSTHQAEFEEVLWKLAAESVDQLEQLYSEAIEFAAQLFGFPILPAKWTISKDEAVFSWRVSTPFEWRLDSLGELDMFPVRWIRRRVQRNYGRSLKTAVATYHDRITRALSEAGSEWVDRLIFDVRDVLKNLRTQVGAAIEDHTVSSISGKVDPLLCKLETMYVKLTNRSHNEQFAPTFLPVGEQRGIRRCFVCERIATELFDFFTKRQYELSINKAEQHMHTESGGFCPLHTWQYERIASPEGVCIPYAPLLADIARSLRGIASSASSPASMMDRIRGIHSSVDKCSACRLAATIEKKAIEEFQHTALSGEEEDYDNGLCLMHLVVMLDRQTDLEKARELVIKEADILDRISENMETYLLKRDGLRRELLSDEELSAYLFGLSFLVGDKRLYVA